MCYRTSKIALLVFCVTLSGGLATHLLPSVTMRAGGLLSGQDQAEDFGQLSATDVVADFVSQRLRQYGENSLLQSDLTEQQLITRFLDESAPFAIRKLDAWRLAVSGSDRARAALLSVLYAGSDAMRAVVAEMLGRSRWSDARVLLARLLIEPNTVVAGGAVAGLVLLGDDKSVLILRDALLGEAAEPDLRTLIALRLADVQSRAALDVLKTAVARRDLPSETWQQVVVSLGRFPFQQTAAVFKAVVNNEVLSSELKTAATEALVDAGQAALPFLADLASVHTEAEVRASAAWALGMHPDTGQMGEQLAYLLKNEADVDVRRRLYEALMRQDTIPAGELLDQALTEQDTAVQVAAANMLALAVRQTETSAALQQRFDEQAVPSLQAIALSDDSLNVRYRAVFALVRAGTEPALSALEEIERQGEPQVAALAGRSAARFTQ